MSLVHAVRFRLRALLDRRRMDAEIDEELAFHLDAQASELERRGMPAPGARREARRLFGGATRLRDDVRDAQGVALLDALWQHVSYAARGVRRAPGFAAMVALTLGLGIGANGAMFGIIDRLLLHGPDGVARPDELRRVYLTERNPAGGEQTSSIQPYPLYTLLRDDSAAFAAVGAYSTAQLRIGSGVDAHTVPAVFATADLFSTLGARPYLGRFFDAAEDRPPAGRPVVVLGYGFWQQQFGADSAVVGRTIPLGSRRVTVIGVAPPHFTGVERAAVDVWLPLSTANRGAPATWPTNWFATSTQTVVRLRAGVAERVADARATARFRGANPYPDSPTARTVSMHPISYDTNGQEPREIGVARLLYGVALVVLLIAAANAANLMLARATRRRRELGVRVALGAGRIRLASMMLAEAGLLALIGGIAGVAFAWWGGALIRRTLLPFVAWEGSPVDVRVMAYTALAVLATTLIVGLIPALRATRGDPSSALKTGIAQSGDQHHRTRTTLQLVQVALSVVLLFTAGLFVRSLLRVRSLDLGLEPGRVVVADLSLPVAEARTRADAEGAKTLERARYRQMLERIRAMPGVERASVAIGTPFHSAFGIGMSLPGRKELPLAKGGGPFINAVGPDYFETVGTRLLRGRTFTAADRERSARVAIVNQEMARTFWPNEDPIGQCLLLQMTDGCTRVVGEVVDARQWKLREDPAMQYYIPFGQEAGIGGTMLLVRPRGDAAAFVGTLRSALIHMAPDARGVTVKTLEASLDPQIRPWHVGALMFGLFGALALLVAAVGLFSVVSYAVAQRVNELGVRIALGARASQVIRLVLGGALGIATAGVAVGVLVALALSPLVGPLLFETGARDPALLGLVAACMIVTALVAGLAPSWRATRIDPMTALRAD